MNRLDALKAAGERYKETLVTHCPPARVGGHFDYQRPRSRTGRASGGGSNGRASGKAMRNRIGNKVRAAVARFENPNVEE